MKVTLAQLNPTVGDVSGNLRKVVDTLERYGGSTDLIVFSEMFLVGYPPRDLLEKPSLIEQVQRALERLLEVSRRHPGAALLVGAPRPTGRDTGKPLSDAAVLIGQGQILFQQNKSLLPAYDVFDETRHFEPASEVRVWALGSESLGISICEDAWYEPELWFRRLYPLDPIRVLAEQGASVLVNISGSPFQMGKQCVRHRLMQNHARRYGLPLVYVNQVGGNDELIFDGGSMALDAAGEAIAILPRFEEAVVTVDLQQPGTPGLYAPQEPSAAVHQALVLGVRDYLGKCGFRQ
ncbi:MAG TPA: nitrilase-related carbon-nitrogen hydrolase, partial [Desulfobaccales bacterium]